MGLIRHSFRNSPGKTGKPAVYANSLRGLVRIAALFLIVGFIFACSEDIPVDSTENCRNLLDATDWDATVTACDPASDPPDTDEERSLAAQAYMGRAGVSLLDLSDKLQNTSLTGLALILDAFTVDVGSQDYTDVESAITLMLAITARDDTDNFNMTIASDVLLVSLFKAHLSMSVDSSGTLVIPGITDAGLDTLSSSSTNSEVQTALGNVYTNSGAGSGSYFTTAPLKYQDSSASVDLETISTFVYANRLGSEGLGLTTDPDLASLASLDFATLIDNGQCGYATSVDKANPGSSTVADATQVAQYFPRRLNTSDSSAVYLADELLFVLLDTSGSFDSAREWGGSFVLPTALLNPDFVGVNCSGVLAIGNFSTCMGSSVLIGSFTAVTESDLATTITCGGSCTAWPVLSTDGTPDLDVEYAAEGSTALTELSAVLDQLYPLDNSVTSGMTGSYPAYQCASGDDLVHYREYDYYLRTFGQ